MQLLIDACVENKWKLLFIENFSAVPGIKEYNNQ